MAAELHAIERVLAGLGWLLLMLLIATVQVCWVCAICLTYEYVFLQAYEAGVATELPKPHDVMATINTFMYRGQYRKYR